MKYIKTLKIDIDKKNFEVIPSVQYDSNTRFLHIQLLNDSVPFEITGCSVILSGVKEDGNPIFNSCDIINSEIGFIQAEVTEQMNAIPGYIDCEIKIYDGEGVLTSKKFTIKVTASQTSRTVESTGEFKALTEALGKVQGLDNRFKETNSQIKDVELKVGNIIAHNGDGTKDSELIQARGTNMTLGERLDCIDYMGHTITDGIELGTPRYVNSWQVGKGWGSIFKPSITTIDKIVVRKVFASGHAQNVSGDITLKVFELVGSTVEHFNNGVELASVLITADTWNNTMKYDTDFIVKLPATYNTDPSKFYAVTLFNPSKLNTAQVGYHPQYDETSEDGKVTSDFIRGIWTNNPDNTGYSDVSPQTYGTYFKILGKNYNKILRLAGKQVPEHEEKLEKIDNDIIELNEYNSKNEEILFSNGIIDISDSINNGESASHNSHNIAHGWGTILKNISIEKIKMVGIKKYNKSINHKASSVSIKLYEMDSFQGKPYTSTEPAIVTNKKLIHTFNVPMNEWVLTPLNSLMKLELPNEVNVVNGKLYGVTVYAGECIEVQQTGRFLADSEVLSNKYFHSGVWFNPNTSNGDELEQFKLAGDPYGLWVSLHETNVINEKVRVIGKQVPEHEEKLSKHEEKLNDIEASIEKGLGGGVYAIQHLLSRDNPLVTNCPNFLDKWLRMDKDLYVVMTGDSILAHQYSNEKSLPSVAEVPPLCDRMAVGGHIWDIVKKGSPQYRRFDYGKNDLISHWSDKWKGGDDPFFTESGNFETYYVSGSNSQSAYDNQYSLTRVSTKITQRDCPINNFGNWDFERWIPRRVATNSLSFIKFKIPAGYSKFDFIYDTNKQADDNVTINVTIGGKGKVKVSTDRSKADFIEADGYVFSQKETNSGDGYDTANVTKRLFFTKPIDEEIEIRIMKSSDTSKYLFYWGVTYWGTANEPYACHLVNTARGSSRLGNIYGERKHRFQSIVESPDLIITELTLINNSSDTTNPTNMINDYIKINNFIKEIGSDRFYLLPNSHKDRLLPPYTTFWDSAKAQLIKDGEAYLDIQKCMYKHWQSLYPNEEVTWRDYFLSLMYDRSCHPNDEGNKYFRYMIEPVFDLL
jgi:hypothetical protein